MGWRPGSNHSSFSIFYVTKFRLIHRMGFDMRYIHIYSSKRWSAIGEKELEKAVRREYVHNILYTYMKLQNIKTTKNEVKLVPIYSHINNKI